MYKMLKIYNLSKKNRLSRAVVVESKRIVTPIAFLSKAEMLSGSLLGQLRKSVSLGYF
jgi:hypothetical protein